MRTDKVHYVKSPSAGDTESSGTVIVDWRRYSAIQVNVNFTGMEWVRTYKGQRPK